MSRRIEPVPAYHQSVAALPQRPEVWEALDTLVRHLTVRPGKPDVLQGTTACAVYTWNPATHHGLRLFYSIDGTTIYLLHVEDWDELLGDD